MNGCPPTDDLLTSGLDPVVVDHLASCISCRVKQGFHLDLESAEVPEGLSADVPSDLEERVSRALDASWAEPLVGGAWVIEDRRWLGAGERGQVFSVFDRTRQRRVALKHVHAVDLERLRQVARVIEGARHPALVGWLDIRSDPTPVVTRPLAQGVMFDEALARSSRQRALQLLARVVSAMFALHREGLAHGSLCPSNIWLEPHGSLLVVDAGLGGLPERSPWRAPELEPDQATAAGDWYALARMVERWAPQLLRGDREAPYAIAGVLSRMLSPDPAERPGSEEVLASVALEQGFGDGEPVRYELGERLAAGGMGELFRAWDPVLKRFVALKRITMGARSLDRIQSFLAEARIGAQLEHPNIVAVHDLGWMDDGAPFLVMKLIDGRELGAVIADHHRDGSVPLTALVDILARLCDAVAYAHSKGVQHGDLKPRNVLIGAYQEVQLIDWGAAQLIAATEPSIDLGGERTGVERVAGTRGYMAPEQAEARVRDMGAHSDVFALGRILFKVLSGQDPPLEGALPSVGAVAPDAPPELVSIADRTQGERPEDRYRSAEALSSDLRAWRAGERVTAHDYGIMDDLERRTRGRRGWILLSLAGVLAVGTAAWFALLGFHASSVAAAREVEREGLVLAEQARFAWVAGDRVEAERRAAAAVATADTPEGRGLLVRLGHVGYPRLAAATEWPDVAPAPCSGRSVTRVGDELLLPGAGLTNDVLTQGVSRDPICDPAVLRLAVARSDEVDIWKLAPLEEDAILDGHDDGVSAMAWSHDGRRLATADGAGRVRLWDAARGRELARLPDHGAVTRLAFAERSTRLVVDGDRPRTWDVGRPEVPERVDAMVPLASVAWHAAALATLDQQGTWRAWDSTDAHFTGREARGAHAAALSPDGAALAVVTEEGRLVVPDRWEGGSATAVAWAGPDVIVAGDALGRIERYDADTGDLLEPPTHEGAAIEALQTAGDVLLVRRAGGRADLGALTFSDVSASAVSVDLVAVATGDRGLLRAIEPRSGRQVEVATLRARVEALAVAPAGDVVAAVGADHAVRMYVRGPQGWSERARAVVDVRSAPGLAFSPDGGTLAVIGLGGTVELWDASVLRLSPSEVVSAVDARYGVAP